jgi:hypothetical protein
MLIIGCAHVVISLVLFFTNWRSFGLGLAVWISLGFLVYRTELLSVGWQHSSGLAVEPLGLSFRATDTLLSFLAVVLFVGGCGVLLHERRLRVKAESQKISCPACGLHIRFDIRNLGEQIACPKCHAAITLRKPEDHLKMSCYFCKGHIEFPPHAIGEKLKCPHCKMDITLTKPAAA